MKILYFLILVAPIFCISGCTYTSEEKINLVCRGVEKSNYDKINPNRNTSKEYIVVHSTVYSFLSNEKFFTKDSKWDLFNDGVKLTYLGEAITHDKNSSDIRTMGADATYIDFHEYINYPARNQFLEKRILFNRITGEWRESYDFESENELMQSLGYQKKISHFNSFVIGACEKVDRKF